MSAATSERMTDYYVAREAHELRLEAACGTRNTSSEEAQRFYAQTGAADLGGETPFTLRRWLEQTRVPAGSPDEVQRVHVTLVQDAQQELADALARVAECVAVRDARLADAQQDGGLSVRELGRMVGISGAMVQRRIARWREGAR